MADDTPLGLFSAPPEELPSAPPGDPLIEPRQRVGDLLTEMTLTLTARRHEAKGDTMAYLARTLHCSTDAIYKWRNGSVSPSASTIAHLVRIGVAQAFMSRVWAEALLQHSRHPDRVSILAELFPVGTSSVVHNLPRRPPPLLGRERELSELKAVLAPERREYAVCIEGTGGIGKTTLALKAAWDFVEPPENQDESRKFDAVIWATAQHTALSASGQITQPNAFSGLQDVYETITRVLDRSESGNAAVQNQARAINLALYDAGAVLLILDNFDAVKDKMSFLAFVRSVPVKTKVIVTSRFHEDFPRSLRLVGLEDEHMRRLLQDEAKAQDVRLSDAQIDKLLRSVEGIPLAGLMAISLMGLQGFGIDRVLKLLEKPDGDVCRFLFRETMTRLDEIEKIQEKLQEEIQQRENTPKRAAIRLCDVLRRLALYFSPEAGASAQRLQRAFGGDLEQYEEALRILRNVNLVQLSRDGVRYTMLPLTRTFVLQDADSQELEHRESERQEFERNDWIQGSLALITECVQPERMTAADISHGYDTLDAEWPNLRMVMDACWQNEGFDVLKTFLIGDSDNVSGLLTRYAEERGKWVDLVKYLGMLHDEAHARPAEGDVEVRAILAKSRILVSQGELEAAQEGLDAVSTRELVVDQATQCEYALVEAMLATQRAQHAKARNALSRLKELSGGLFDDAWRRHYDVQRLFCEGELAQHLKDYPTARRYFEEVCALAEGLAWTRMRARALLHLGMIATVTAVDDEDYKRARDALNQGQRLAHKRDAYVQAQYYEGCAELAKRLGDVREMRKYANVALGLYNGLDVSAERERMKRLVEM